MLFLIKVGQWIAAYLPTIVKIGKKVAEFANAAKTVADAHLEGRSIVSGSFKKRHISLISDVSAKRPDLIGTVSEKTKFDEVLVQLDDNKRQLTSLDQGNFAEHRRIALQIDVMELIVCSQTFERFTNNINLHAANLQIHLQTIRNTAGLFDAVNRQRRGIKALMGTVNHLINVLKLNEKVEKIEGIDVDMKQGAISIIDTYKAFEDTRDLLINELANYQTSILHQLERADRVRVTARTVDGLSMQVSKWLEKSVEMSLHEAHKLALELKSELEMIPRLEAELRRDLVRNDW